MSRKNAKREKLKAIRMKKRVKENENIIGESSSATEKKLVETIMKDMSKRGEEIIPEIDPKAKIDEKFFRKL